MSGNDVKVIDAVCEPVNAGACNTGAQGVPLKIDTSQMQKALQEMVSQQMRAGLPGAVSAAGVQTDTPTERINPSTYIKTISEEMEKLYARFDKLKRLATELHGKQLDAPLPEHIKLKNIVINFSITKNGATEDHSAEIHAVSSIGDLTGLMSTEFGLIILSLTEQSKQLADLAQKTGDRCSTALREWQNNNKDKKIVRPDDANSVSVEAGAQTNNDAPITLEAS